LGFSGFSPVRVYKIGYLAHFSSMNRRDRIKRKFYKCGRKAK
jgi:hypothetical protein